MRKTITFSSALIFCVAGISMRSIAQGTNKNYDEKLAGELKADDYGMKK